MKKHSWVIGTAMALLLFTFSVAFAEEKSNNLSAGAFLVSGVGTGFGAQLDYSLASQLNMPVSLRGSFSSQAGNYLGVSWNASMIGAGAVYNFDAGPIKPYAGLGIVNLSLTGSASGFSAATGATGIGYVLGASYPFPSGLSIDAQLSSLVQGFAVGANYSF